MSGSRALEQLRGSFGCQRKHGERNSGRWVMFRGGLYCPKARGVPERGARVIMVRRRRLEGRLPGCADDGEQLLTRGCKQRDRGKGASAAAGSSSPLDNWYGARLHHRLHFASGLYDGAVRLSASTTSACEAGSVVCSAATAPLSA